MWGEGGMKYCARKRCGTLCKFLFVVTEVLGKMWQFLLKLVRVYEIIRVNNITQETTIRIKEEKQKLCWFPMNIEKCLPRSISFISISRALHVSMLSLNRASDPSIWKNILGETNNMDLPTRRSNMSLTTLAWRKNALSPPPPIIPIYVVNVYSLINIHETGTRELFGSKSSGSGTHSMYVYTSWLGQILD